MKSALLAIVIGSAFLSKAICAQPVSTTVSTSKKIKMKQFSLLVRVPENYGTEQAKSVGPEWDKLIDQWKATNVYVLSFAFPGESHTVSGKGKQVKKETVLSDGLKVVSNVVLEAETVEQALELAKSCPILLYDGSVEVREIPKGVSR